MKVDVKIDLFILEISINPMRMELVSLGNSHLSR